ncbi:MAG: ABC transporter ATP-binding protein [Pseudanabaenaceae cyanobacterium]
MGETIIRVENLGKKYLIGHQGKGYGSFREMLSHRLRRLWTPANPPQEDYREEFWALQDINFEVQRGDRVGIIGRNGAGKSTLLKILSRITEPTTGRITIRGRVASLLEVGTGFHPELTGRENIFLNGVILGMKRAEIQRKFDEIVAFAEVEKFLDTPVKHYSSGMYVRLAFAVAAHLDPEILVVDEVLAVGDAAFQKKCLGKMEDVAEKEGRTVLFVSHTMSAITRLCDRVLWLAKGQAVGMGNPQNMVSRYLLTGAEKSGEVQLNPQDNPDARFTLEAVRLRNELGEISSIFDVLKPIVVEIDYRLAITIANLEMSLRIVSGNGTIVCSSNRSQSLAKPLRVGRARAYIQIPALFLVPGIYSISIGIHVPKMEILAFYEDLMTLEIQETGSPMAIYHGANYGVVFTNWTWQEQEYEGIQSS